MILNTYCNGRIILVAVKCFKECICQMHNVA